MFINIYLSHTILLYTIKIIILVENTFILSSRKKVYYQIYFNVNIYNKLTLLGIISKLYTTQGINTIIAITTGSSIVQENDIN